MINHPFQPNDERDKLNTTLDVLATGARAPETSQISDPDALTATVHLINGQPAAPAEYPSDDTLDTIWRNVMHSQTHGVSAPKPFASFSPNGTEFKGRIANVPPRAESSRFASWLSIAAMIALLVGLVGGAWTMRGGTDGSDEPSRLAAVMPLGTPGASPDDGINWSSWIAPEECTLDRMPPSEVTKLQAETEGWPVPTYGSISEPSPTDAKAAATGARALTSCFMFRSDGSYSSKTFLWRYTSPNSPLSLPEMSLEHQESNGRDVSRELDGLTPSDLLVTTAVAPNEIQEEMPMTFLPEQAIQFPDGRIGIPAAYLIPESAVQEDLETLYTVLFVLNNESGGWLLDDSLSICVGDCDDYINGGPWEGNAYTMPETDVNGTPEASPSSDSEWLRFAQPEECTVEPMTSEEYGDIMRVEQDISGRSYEVIGPADPETAEAVARAARAHEACLSFGSYDQVRSLESPAFMFYKSANIYSSLSPEEKNAADSEHGRYLSTRLPQQDPSAYEMLAPSRPVKQENRDLDPNITCVYSGYAFLPERAMLLRDNRIAIPAIAIYGFIGPDTVPLEQMARISDQPAQLLILTNQSGLWKIDEILSFCVSNCDHIWAEKAGAPVTADATPIASPIATPEG